MRVSQLHAKLKDVRLHRNNSLQHYLRQMNPKAPSYVLSKGECQVAFQHWVAYVRGGDHGYPYDITAKEHLRCPLLWCRESFDNLATTLQHVSECPWLSNAWYWCPYCCRPESFIFSEEPFINAREDKLRRKDSKLKRAMTFFKHLGHKSCSPHKHSGSAAQGSESFDTWFDMWLAEQQQSELEDTSHKVSTRGELADSGSGVRDRPSYSEDQAKKVYEMEGTPIDTPHGPHTLSRYTQEANSTSRPCDLDVEPQHMEPHLRAELPSPVDPFLGIGAQFGRGLYEVEPRRQTNEVPFRHQSAEPITSTYVELDSTSLVHNGPEAVSSPEVAEHQWYQENVTLPDRVPQLTADYHGHLHDDATSMSSPVNDLRETVRILNEEWLQRCQSTSDILLRASALSPQSLFDMGAQTLRLIFQGVIPSTFDAVFALAHIACAAAYITHGDDRLHCWNEFLQNILDWQNLIRSKSDAQLFVQLVNLLCCHQCSSAQRVCGNYFLDESSGTLVPLHKPVVDLNAGQSTRTIELQASRHPAKPVSMTTLRSLKGGVVIQECSRFLDGKSAHQHSSNKIDSGHLVGVEYAMILERSKLFPTHLSWYAQNHVTNIEELLRTIIHPLQHCDGIEALHNTIDHTAIELKSGSLRTVREVEVSLISNSKVSIPRGPPHLMSANQRYITVILPVAKDL